jgi:putative MFS transporter
MVPFALRDWGIGPTMLIAAVLTAIGWLVCLFMAEETRNLSLGAPEQTRNVAASANIEV